MIADLGPFVSSGGAVLIALTLLIAYGAFRLMVWAERRRQPAPVVSAVEARRRAVLDGVAVVGDAADSVWKDRAA